MGKLYGNFIEFHPGFLKSSTSAIWGQITVNSGRWWWTGRLSMLRVMGSQSRTRLSDWTELNWTVLQGLRCVLQMSVSIPGFCVPACLVPQACLTLCDPMDWGCQTPQSMGFPRQEYWSGLPFPFPEDIPDPGVKPGPPALQADSFPSEHPGYFALTWGKWQHSCQKRQLMSLVLLVPSMKEKGSAIPALFVPTSLACNRVTTPD